MLNILLIKLQKEIMAIEETLARYKAWVAEHPQVAHFLEKVKSNPITLVGLVWKYITLTNPKIYSLTACG